MKKQDIMNILLLAKSNKNLKWQHKIKAEPTVSKAMSKSSRVKWTKASFQPFLHFFNNKSLGEISEVSLLSTGTPYKLFVNTMLDTFGKKKILSKFV